jgi:hypothetical protein
MVAVLLVVSVITIPRPVSATGDFRVTANPAKVTIPLGYWGDVLLTVTSVDGLEGTVQLDIPVGGNTGLSGSGFSTGMLLSADGTVNTVIMLTPGPSAGNYTVTINVTVGSVAHSLSLPVTISPVSGPDFITRLWGSYSILQSWSSPIQEEITSLGGFSGEVSLTASVTPIVPDVPVVSFQPSLVTVWPAPASTYVATLSAARNTPTGNYVVTVWVTNGTISHSYSAILMVGDYRPQTEEPPQGNATTISPTTPPLGGPANSQMSPVSGLSPALTVLESLWWLESVAGAGFITAVLQVRRRHRIG